MQIQHIFLGWNYLNNLKISIEIEFCVLLNSHDDTLLSGQLLLHNMLTLGFVQ